MRIGNRNGEAIVSAEWFDEELQGSVKRRVKKRKAWRMARTKNHRR